MIEEHPWLDRKQYPFESNYLELAMGRLHYVDAGEGEAIMMLHGQPTWSFMYRETIRGLAPRYRCIAPDHIGFGLSDKPCNWSYRPEQHAENVGRLIDHLGLERVTLLVHDWGGPIGLGYAVDHPSRIHRVIALDTWMWSMAEHRAGRIFSHVMGNPIGRWATRRFNLFIRVFLRRGLAAHWDEVAASYSGPLARREDREGCAQFPKHLLAPWLNEVWEKRAALREKRALLVWGERDPAFPPSICKRLASVFADCEVDTQPGVGHFVAEEMGYALAVTIDRFMQKDHAGMLR